MRVRIAALMSPVIALITLAVPVGVGATTDALGRLQTGDGLDGV